MTPDLPAWVIPDVQQVGACRDRLLVLAMQGAHPAGALAALDWALGTGPAPVTDAPPAPDRDSAIAEEVISSAIGMGLTTWPTFDGRQPVNTDKQWVWGATRTIGWLTGTDSTPPIRLH